MKVNKEKLKKIFQIVFYVLGGLAITFVVILFIDMYFPSEDDYLSSDSSYDYTEEDKDYSEGAVSEDSVDESSNESSEEIKTGELSIVVDDIDEAKAELNEIKDKYNGSITYSYESGDGLERYVTIVVKIEVEDFEKAFEDLSEIDGEVEYSYTNVTDITEEYVDLEARLTNLEATETQLLEIMEDAETVEDTMSVYSELASVRSEIEVIKGEIRYLDSQTDYSYITVTFSLSSVGAEISEEEWKPLGVLKDAFRSFVSALKGFVNVLIWILVFSPIVIVAGGIYLIVKKIRKSKK